MGDEVLFVRSKQVFDEGESSMNENDAWDDTALIEAYDNAVSLAKDEVKRRMKLTDVEVSPSSIVQNASGDSQMHSKRKKWNKMKNTPKQNRWVVGDTCRCIYSEDGLSYEACIIKVNPMGTCVVKYVGYDNEEEVNIANLQFSHGHAARLRQAEEANPEMEFTSFANDDIWNSEERSTPENKFNGRSPHPQTKTNEKRGGHSRSKDKSTPKTRHEMISPLPQYPAMGSVPMMFPPPPPPNILGSNDMVDDAEALSSMLLSWYMSGFHTGFYQGVKQKASGCKCKCSQNSH